MKLTRYRNERGQAIVEFALVLPILMAILLGIIQFGIIFNNYITLTDATRAGARKAAVSRFLNDNGASAKQAVIDSAQGLDPDRPHPDGQRHCGARLVDGRQPGHRHCELPVLDQHSRLDDQGRELDQHHQGASRMTRCLSIPSGPPAGLNNSPEKEPSA